jgi:hypothetical protein
VPQVAFAIEDRHVEPGRHPVAQTMARLNALFRAAAGFQTFCTARGWNY